MADAWRGFSDAELEQALTDLGRHLSYPPAPDLSGAVRAHLETHPVPPRSLRSFLTRRAVLYPLLAALVVVTSVLALSPGARSSVASWFHIVGVQIGYGRPPGPLGRSLNLGKQVSLAEAQKRVPFRVLVPALPGLEVPDEVYLGAPPVAGSVSLVYRARRGLPRAATTGAGLLITEFQRRFWDAKVLSPRTTIEPVGADGVQGVWLAGEPHDLFYVNGQGKLVRDTGRLAGNALIWQHDGLALRMEGRISEGRAMAIARSMKPG